MLTDTVLRNLKPKPKIYRVFDRDEMYMTVLIWSFRTILCREIREMRDCRSIFV